MKNSMKNVEYWAVMTMIVLGAGLANGQTKSQLTATQTARCAPEKLEIKTYLKKPPDLNPRFFELGEHLQHQGVQRHVYPYRADDNLTDDTTTRSYETYRMENDYIKINVIPELGGRIYSALDKTDNYEFVYRNIVIKPSLIGMVGSWISGGIAWGFPHHHGPLTMAPFEHRAVDNPDGSKTVWVAKTDYRTRMRMLLGITVRPDKSYIDVEVFLDNRTPLVNSFLYWANPSAKADPTYQIFFGPSVQYATYHAKVDFIRWPVGDGSYQGVDYTGTDVSWWKNVMEPSSFFCWNTQDDFIAGYSHGLKGGIAYIGEHHTLPGMKVWEHGDNPEGNAWRALLTDNSDHYIEMMAGGFSDNEPDYSWMQPYETKHFHQYWFPIRDLDGVDFANLNGVLSLRLAEGNQVRIRINTTSPQKDAKVVLKAKGVSVFERTAAISPDNPFATDVHVDAEVKNTDLELTLLNSQGQELLRFQPQTHAKEPMPEPRAEPGKPEDFKSVEELYLAGLRLDQFFDYELDSKPYFDEALKRDPGNYEVNVWLAIKACKDMRWAEAERRLRTALARVTYHFTRPKDGEAYYYLGVALRAQGKFDEAYDQFFNAVWSSAYYGPGYFALAGLDCRKGDFRAALEHIDRALSANASSFEMLCLKAVILRKCGRTQEAMRLAKEIGKLDELNFQSRNELLIAEQKSGKGSEAKLALAELNRIMRGDEEVYLELACEYAKNGFLDEAIGILSRFAANGDSQAVGPMVNYHLGYLWEQKGDAKQAAHYCELASRGSRDYVFPYWEESRVALEHARLVNPNDALAPYLSGNLLYEHQPELAIKDWEAARTLDPNSAMVHRNLAWGYKWYEKDLGKAIASLEEAVKLDGSDARLLYELDVAYEAAKVSPERRLAMLQQHRAAAEKRDDAMTRLAKVLVLTGNYDDAIQILATHHFHVWEGNYGLVDVYKDALQIRGLERLRNHDAQGALADFLKADEYPANFEIGRPPEIPRFAQNFYLIGLGYDAVGDTAKAREYYRKALAEKTADSEYLYYTGLAFRKLNQPEQAAQMFTELERLSRGHGFANRLHWWDPRLTPEQEEARRHFIRGLAYSAKGLQAEADAQFAEAASGNPTATWYRYFLNAGDSGGIAMSIGIGH
jgi:tetratricopeptide (TPR) repeat protein